MKIDNNFSPELNNTQLNDKQRKATLDNEEKDYCEIVEEDEDADYSVPNSKLNEINKSQFKIINLIGNG